MHFLSNISAFYTTFRMPCVVPNSFANATTAQSITRQRWRVRHKPFHLQKLTQITGFRASLCTLFSFFSINFILMSVFNICAKKCTGMVGDWVRIYSRILWYNANTILVEYYLTDDSKTQLKTLLWSTMRYVTLEDGKSSDHARAVVDFLEATSLHFDPSSLDIRHSLCVVGLGPAHVHDRHVGSPA